MSAKLQIKAIAEAFAQAGIGSIIGTNVDSFVHSYGPVKKLDTLPRVLLQFGMSFTLMMGVARSVLPPQDIIGEATMLYFLYEMQPMFREDLQSLINEIKHDIGKLAE